MRRTYSMSDSVIWAGFGYMAGGGGFWRAVGYAITIWACLLLVDYAIKPLVLWLFADPVNG